MSPKDVETKPKEKRPIKWYWWAVVIILVFTMGNSYGKANTANVVTTQAPATKTITQECDYTDWEALKSKDDEIILLAGLGFGIVSEAFEAASRLDIDTMDQKAAELEKLADRLGKLASERNAILKKLGL